MVLDGRVTTRRNGPKYRYVRRRTREAERTGLGGDGDSGGVDGGRAAGAAAAGAAAGGSSADEGRVVISKIAAEKARKRALRGMVFVMSKSFWFGE